MFRSHVLLAAAIALPISTGPAAAQEIGQPSRGLALAQRLCSECHAVEKHAALSVAAIRACGAKAVIP